VVSTALAGCNAATRIDAPASPPVALDGTAAPRGDLRVVSLSLPVLLGVAFDPSFRQISFVLRLPPSAYH
jgi:hypothetical protein